MNPKDIMNDAIHNFHPQYQHYTQYHSSVVTKALTPDSTSGQYSKPFAGPNKRPFTQRTFSYSFKSKDKDGDSMGYINPTAMLDGDESDLAYNDHKTKSRSSSSKKQKDNSEDHHYSFSEKVNLLDSEDDFP